MLTLLGLLSLGLVPHAVQAQRGAPPRQPTLGTVPAGPTDTMMVSGRQDFTHYTTPGMCLRAATTLDQTARLADEDTAFTGDHTHDTLATAAVVLARRCGTRFTVANTGPADQLDLMHLALYMGNDSLARAAGDRYVASFTEPEAHRWALYALDTTYLLGTKPIRLSAAEAVTARLDSLGVPAAMQRAKAHAYLLLHARLRYDLAAIEREALALIAADNQVTMDNRTLWDGGNAGGDAAGMIFFLELYRNPKEALARTEQRLKGLGYTQWHADMPLPGGLDRGIAQVGKLVPPLKADFWVGADSTHRVWPVPGAVSVYITSSLNAINAENDSVLRSTARWEAARMTKWRRMLTKYGSAFQVTVLAKTHGSFLGGPPLSPAEEATQLGRFYREELGVPVTVAVQTTPIKQLPDGRRILGTAPFERDPYYGEHFILADRDGRVLLALPRLEQDEAMLNAWLARAVGR